MEATRETYIVCEKAPTSKESAQRILVYRVKKDTSGVETLSAASTLNDDGAGTSNQPPASEAPSRDTQGTRTTQPAFTFEQESVDADTSCREARQRYKTPDRPSSVDPTHGNILQFGTFRIAAPGSVPDVHHMIQDIRESVHFSCKDVKGMIA